MLINNWYSLIWHFQMTTVAVFKTPFIHAATNTSISERCSRCLKDKEGSLNGWIWRIPHHWLPPKCSFNKAAHSLACSILFPWNTRTESVGPAKEGSLNLRSTMQAMLLNNLLFPHDNGCISLCFREGWEHCYWLQLFGKHHIHTSKFSN